MFGPTAHTSASLATHKPPMRDGWARCYSHGRMAGLAAAFAMAPFLIIVPETSVQALPVLAAVIGANLAGLAATQQQSPIVTTAISFAGLLLLGIGLGSGLTLAAAGAAIIAMMIDVMILPSNARRTLAPALTATAALLALFVFLAPAAGSIQAGLAVLLLPLAAITSASLHLSALGKLYDTVVDRADKVVQREETLIAAAHAAVVIVEQGGHVLNVTPDAGRVLAAAASELAGRGLVERVLIADRPAFLKAIADAAIDRHGSQLTLRLACGAASALQGHRLFLLTIEPAAADILAASIRIIEAGGRTAHGNADRAGLFQTLSHEVRTPMNAILGFSELLANPGLQPGDPKKVAEYAGLIHSSARNSFAVMRALVDLLRVESTEFNQVEALDIDDMLRSTLSQLQGREPDGMLTVSTSGSAGPAQGDPRALRMLLSALLEGLSAASASPAHIHCALGGSGFGPTIDIDIRPRPGAGEARNKEAFLGVVQELSHRLAAALDAEMVIEPAGAGWSARTVFRHPAAVTPLAKPRAHPSNSVVTLRKSA